MARPLFVAELREQANSIELARLSRRRGFRDFFCWGAGACRGLEIYVCLEFRYSKGRVRVFGQAGVLRPRVRRL